MPKGKKKADQNVISWEKPNGKKITTNAHPANIKAAEALGWKRVK